MRKAEQNQPGKRKLIYEGVNAGGNNKQIERGESEVDQASRAMRLLITSRRKKKAGRSQLRGGGTLR